MQIVKHVTISGVWYQNMEVLSLASAQERFGKDFRNTVVCQYWPTDENCDIPLGMTAILAEEYITNIGWVYELFLMQKQEWAKAKEKKEHV